MTLRPQVQDAVKPDDASPVLVTDGDLRFFVPHPEQDAPARIAVAGLPSRTFSVFVEDIPAGSATDMQRHHHEGAHYIVRGHGYSEIGDEVVEWQAGDMLYTPVWVWHRHYNASDVDPVRMLGVSNTRLLVAAGGLNRRESLGAVSVAQLHALELDTEEASA